MQIRKCALIEMFSLVLIGMFSPFFHIIGSRIGAFGLFPFGNVSCVSSIQRARAHMDGCVERAVPHGWTRAERISRPTAQAQDRTGPRQPGESPAAASCRANPAAAAQSRTEGRRRRGRPPGDGAGATTGHRRVPGGAARPRPRLPATACARRARRVRAAHLVYYIFSLSQQLSPFPLPLPLPLCLSLSFSLSLSLSLSLSSLPLSLCLLSFFFSSPSLFSLPLERETRGRESV